MDCAKSCRFRTDFVQICVQNISDFCSKSDSNMCNVSSASSPQELLNCIRALPKIHIGFERKSARFLSRFDQIYVPNLIDFCSKSEPKLNFCENKLKSVQNLIQNGGRKILMTSHIFRSDFCSKFLLQI